MADYVAVLPHIKFHLNKYCVSEQHAGPKYPLFKISRASPFKVNFLSSGSICKLSALHISKIKAGPYNKECFLKDHCLGTLININGAATSEWITVIDQVLLMTSVLLTFMARVITVEKSLLNSRSFLQDRMVPEDNTFLGSAANDGDEVKLKFAWDTVRSKLVDGLSTIERSDNLGNEVIGKGQQRPSSLFAISEAPRVRLMLASIHWLKKEVDNVPGNSSSRAVPEVLFPQIIQRSCETLCIAWLAEELRLKDSGGDERLLSAIGKKISGYDSITQNIQKSGKKDLYAELVCILRFGFLWKNSCYNYNFFTRHGVSVLEDLVISLADGISSMFLELISVDGDMSNEMNSLGLNLCTLSTRALQRLRNEVVLSQWLYQNMDAVASMYEDRFDLRTLEIQVIQNPINSETQKFSWWKNLGWVKAQSVLSPLRFVVINSVSVPVKRTKELRSLTGWRYYYSLFLELSDILMPLIRTIVSKVSDATSFFLVSLIGRSLGLIYTGIRQSLRWK